MQSKLQTIAETFVREVGNDLSQYTFVFPNHRAGLFFRKYLGLYVSKPMFAPRVMTINECFAELSDLVVTDQLTLLLRLYSAYQRLHSKSEGLDRFIYWGKMMLADFSEIDNHLVKHVEALFSFVKDWHAIDERFSYLSENQRLALSRFWKEFYESDEHHRNSKMHQDFLHTWDLLYPLYTALRDSLLQDGLAYEGMLHREVIEHWNDIPSSRFREQYVFLGFNALTTSERELMLRLQQMGRADFYFDYDSPYLSDPMNKASMFMEENLRVFKSKFDVAHSPDEFNQELKLISVSSMMGETHEVHRILSDIIPVGCKELTRTAVVLPDEQLLIPLLDSIPTSVEKINVTMGYPLRATLLYMSVAYPEEILRPMPTEAHEFIVKMRECLTAQSNPENAEAIYQLLKVLNRLETALDMYPEIGFTVVDMQQLLKMMTLETTIPYVGEPLDGLQVMGVLETRALDFDNVIITGFNDDLYPGRAANNSFIPYTLRCGFDLPTIDRQNAIFSYNFYRMISYAKRVWFITNSTSDEQHSGEVSRYFYQLKWQYGVDIEETIVTSALGTDKQSTGGLSIEKDKRILDLRKISPTSLTTYLRCPKQFYFKYIEHLEEPKQDETVLVSDLTLGKVLHAVMQDLYAPFVGKNVSALDIEHLLKRVNDDVEWEQFSALQDLGSDILAKQIVRTYVNNILNYDYQSAPFQYVGSEIPVERPYCLSLGQPQLLLTGYIDRLDLKTNILRVIDYKTGRTDLTYTSMEDVFGVVAPREDGVVIRKKGKSQLLQTMLYCWLLEKCENKNIPVDVSKQAHIFSARRLSDTDVITYMHSKDGERNLIFDQDMQMEFEKEMRALLEEMFNLEIPYHPTSESNTCSTCPFAQLCAV